MASNDDLLVWVDLETTGLLADADLILEIGVTVTDIEGNNPVGYESLVLNPDPLLRGHVEEVVRDMHDASGLWSDLDKAYEKFPDSGGPDEIQDLVLGFLSSMDLNPGVHEMAGSSVQFDRGFLLHHMPKLHNWFHYRNLDVSSVKNMCRRLNPPVYAQLPHGRKLHRVLPDIHDSIAEYQFYLDNFVMVHLPLAVE